MLSVRPKKVNEPSFHHRDTETQRHRDFFCSLCLCDSVVKYCCRFPLHRTEVVRAGPWATSRHGTNLKIAPMLDEPPSKVMP
jgi:hypothetical protein